VFVNVIASIPIPLNTVASIEAPITAVVALTSTTESGNRAQLHAFGSARARQRMPGERISL